MPRGVQTLYVLLSILSQLIVGLLLGLAAWPGFWLLRWTWLRLGSAIDSPVGALVFCLAIGAAFVLCGNALLLLVVALRHMLRLYIHETRSEVLSPAAVRPALNNLLLHTASFFYLPFIKSSYFIVWFYRAMGARIGKGTLIATNRIWDCDLVEIGEDCLIGANASISAHYVVGQRAALRKVRIGDNVTIGANTSVMAGARIEDNVTVGANSLVPLGAHLKSGGLYLGVPVQRTNQE